MFGTGPTFNEMKWLPACGTNWGLHCYLCSLSLVFMERGTRKSRHGKATRQTFFGKQQIQQVGNMKNTHEFYVANPQNPSVDVWFTRDQRGLISICTIGCKGWCSTLQSFPNTWKCPTLPWKICIPMALKLAAATSAHLMSQSSHRFPYPSLSHKVSF